MTIRETVFEGVSPAKLNLFLHITGRRSDGYHNLQTVFQLLDWGDDIRIEANRTGKITLACPKIPLAPERNLAFRAAVALRSCTRNFDLGAHIEIDKHIPDGAGLGGGSSNAASVLLVLNTLWDLKFDKDKLASIGRDLGADVPVFVNGLSAWAEGIGEHLTPVKLPETFFLVVKPQVSIATAEIFQSKELTRDTPAITIAAFFEGRYRNDCQRVAFQKFPEVKAIAEWLGQFGTPRLTGTGSCVFLECQSRAQADKIAQQVPAGSQAFVAQGVNQSPIVTALK
jgi:4-diphosphocytidyl-2-C-methyl-D-erythritol kinase